MTLRRRALILVGIGSGVALHHVYRTYIAPPNNRYETSFAGGLGLAKAFPYIQPVAAHIVDAESSHRYAVSALALSPSSRYALGLTDNVEDDPILQTTVFNMRFTNPVGLAAGFDKNGECIDGLFDCGFAFVEIGSVTPLSQPGNPRPRVFRLTEDRAIINRYGFNSDGADTVKQRLTQRQNQQRNSQSSSPDARSRIIGINFGKNKLSESAVDDYTRCVEHLGSFADYIVINVSSPNTVGLRALQSREALQTLLTAAKRARDRLQTPNKPPPPLLLKIAPDITDDDCHDIADVSLSVGIDGLIISNTTIQRNFAEIRSPLIKETGGLSGPPLRHISTALISQMYQRTNGQLPIIGVGGIESGRDAYEKTKSGSITRATLHIISHTADQ